MKYIPNAVSFAVGRAVLKTQKNSPVILFGAGVVGVATTVVLACRATLKVNDVLDHMEKEKVDLDQLRNLVDTKGEPAYSDSEIRKDQVFFYTRSGLEIAKLYAPTLIVGTLSIGLLGGSHYILSKRNVAVMAAYASVDKAFKEYRKNVIEEFGEESDKQFLYGTEIVQEKVVDKNGKTKTIDVRVIKDGSPSMYARFFDQSSRRWQRQYNYNVIWLEAQQSYANDLLRNRGHVFLNEIYDVLGLERSKAGQVVGWVLGNDGDQFIDFGIFRDPEAGQRWMNAESPGILLDFNVQGIVHDLLEG